MYFQKKSNNCSLCICYLKVIEGQVSLSTLFGVHIEKLYQQFIFSDVFMVLKDPRFKSCERIYMIDFSLFLKIKSLDTVV